MDLIMVDAQRQGRLSFYMVCQPPFNQEVYILSISRSQQARRVSQLAQPPLSRPKTYSSASTEKPAFSSNEVSPYQTL